MNIHVSTPPQAERKSRVGLAIADGDIHPRAKERQIVASVFGAALA